MLGRHVERVEAMPLVLDFRAFDDGEAHAGKDRFHAIAYERQRMAAAERGLTAGQRHVEAGALERRAFGRFAAGFSGLVDLLLDVGLESIGAGAPLTTFLRRNRPEVLQQACDQSVFASQITIADGLYVAR